MKDIRMNCRNFFDVGLSDKYALKNFTFEDIEVNDEKQAFSTTVIEGTMVKNMKINGVKLPNKR
jgi:hypothetical protein